MADFELAEESNQECRSLLQESDLLARQTGPDSKFGRIAGQMYMAQTGY
jgi:hypothetical protein